MSTTSVTLGGPENTKMTAATVTAPARSSTRCACVHSPTGPVRTPCISPVRRSQPRLRENSVRVPTAAADGPVRKAPAATTRPSANSVRRPSLMNRTSVSYIAAAASAGSLLSGTLFR
jgi:hypothetical protein